MKFLFICFLASLSLVLGVVPHWKKCPASDPNANECLRESIQKALKDLEHGSTAGFEDLNPVSFPTIPILDSNSGSFRGKLIYNDVEVSGLEGATVKKVEKRGGNVLRGEFFFPMTKITGKYVMDTTLLAVPMKGKGDFELVTKNLSITFDFKIKTKTIDGVKYYNAESVTQPSFIVDFLQVYHTNLFGGNKALGDNVNRLLNQNWRTLAKELGPVTIKSFSPIYVKVTNSILNKIPVNEFPIEI